MKQRYVEMCQLVFPVTVRVPGPSSAGRDYCSQTISDNTSAYPVLESSLAELITLDIDLTINNYFREGVKVESKLRWSFANAIACKLC